MSGVGGASGAGAGPGGTGGGRPAWWVVLKREYLVRVRSRWFVVGTVAGPLVFLALVLAPLLLSGGGGAEGGERVVLVDESGRLAPSVGPRMEALGLRVVEVVGGLQAGLDRRLAEGQADLVVVVGEETLARGAVRVRAREPLELGTTLAIRQAVTRAALEARLGGAGDEVSALLSGGELRVELLGDRQVTSRDALFLRAYVGAFLLYMVVLIYAVAVMRSVLEEKTSRIVEIVVSAVRPFDLMLGKILGVGLVGLTQLVVWVAAGVVIARLGGPALAALRPGAGFSGALPGGLSQVLPGPGYLGLFLLFFVGGYFIYSGLYASVGAMCSTDEEAQQAQFPVVFLLVIPILFVGGVIDDPDAGLSVALSFVPFFTPVLMFARAVAGQVQPWELVASAALMAATVLVVAWVAGRIYRVGILMTGKRPTPGELLRWIRES